MSNLEVYAKDQSGKVFPVRIDDSAVDEGTGKVNLAFTPESEGSISLFVKFAEDPEKEIVPLVVPVKPAPFARVPKWPRSSSARVGKSITIPFDTNLDIKDDIFSVTVDEDGKKFPISFKGNDLKFTPKRATKYTILATVDGKPIDGMS